MTRRGGRTAAIVVALVAAALAVGAHFAGGAVLQALRALHGR